MNHYATLRFYDGLNDFLKTSLRQKAIQYPLKGRQSVKDMIESLGVPHTEAAMIIANGEPVQFGYLVMPGDRIAVYPAFRRLEMDSESLLQPATPDPPLFIADAHLGRLARYLRMLGFDCLYRKDSRDKEIINSSLQENRIILTRDMGILKNGKVTYGYFIRSQEPKKQLMEVVNHYHLYEKIRPFERCMICNGILKEVEMERVKDQAPPKTLMYYDRFFQCSNCGKAYWEGSHFENMKKFIEGIPRPW